MISFRKFPKRRVELYKAIRLSFFTQREVAAVTEISEARLSGILNGWQEPRLNEMVKLSKLLERPVSELFPELRDTEGGEVKNYRGSR